VFKNSTIDFNALFNSPGNSTCRSLEVVLAFLLYDGSTIHNSSDQFVSCVYIFFVDFAFHPSPQKSKGIRSVRANFKQLCLHTNWKLDTCLYELIYSEWSILPPPKIFSIPPETPCVTVNKHNYWLLLTFNLLMCHLQFWITVVAVVHVWYLGN